jgi:hypothetical protein
MKPLIRTKHYKAVTVTSSSTVLSAANSTRNILEMNFGFQCQSRRLYASGTVLRQSPIISDSIIPSVLKVSVIQYEAAKRYRKLAYAFLFLYGRCLQGLIRYTILHFCRALHECQKQTEQQTPNPRVTYLNYTCDLIFHTPCTSKIDFRVCVSHSHAQCGNGSIVLHLETNKT